MSRTNPNKKKRRSASKTVLIYGEGLDEEVFLKYIRGIFAFNSNVAITVRRGKGGTADGLVMQASKAQGAFNKRVVALDNDKPNQEMERARALANEKGIELCESTPCSEALLLSILNKGKSFSTKTSKWCKGEFESKYLDSKKRGEFPHYEKLFTKKLLNEVRLKLSQLDNLICIMEGK